MIPIFYRPEMVAHAESYSPSAAKPKIVIDHWLAKGRIQPEQLRSFEPADIEDFTLAHDEHFVRAVLSLEEDNGFGTRSQAVADSLLYTTGSMIAAMQHVLEHGGFACSPTSGFHHAGRNYASGFCTFNCRFCNTHALLMFLYGKLHNQHRIFTQQTNQHHQT